MNSKRRGLVLLVPGMLLLAACGQQGAGESAGEPSASANALDTMSIEELVAAAEEEGEVVVYSFTSRIEAVEEAFEAEYPGIDLVGSDISSTEQIARLQAEADAGVAEADVAYISDAPVVFGELVQSGILRPYVPTAFTESVPARYQEPLLANRLSTKILMYNEETYPDGSPVSNLWELTTEEWTGKVVMVDPLVRGDYLDLMTEFVLRADEMAEAYEALNGEAITLDDGIDNAGEQFIADLLANDAVLVDDTDNVNAAIGALGQDDPPVGFTSYSDRRDNEDEGWALQVADGVAPAPGIAFPALLGVVDGGPHPAAARLLIHFLMGDDSETGGPGFEPFYVAGDYPTRTDITPPEDALSLEEVGAWEIDPVATFGIRQDVADLILTLQ
ncbi:MAG: ABC transporter substrate-binding protein [Chloroflexota bacterium]|nr:ABC transporter substrate-binding protein [Chloroflexota bacterium]